MSVPPSYDVVIPTVGRVSLHRVLDAVLFGRGPAPDRVVVVDDRPAGSDGDGEADRALDLPSASVPVLVLRSYGSGPAGARNVGWVAGCAEWVAFLDDDVEPPFDWRDRVAHDLAAVHDDPGVAGSQANVVVPKPRGRRPTDWERNVGGLAVARWITADLAYRRTALETVGGFDERFRRAYREDSDLALQVTSRVGEIVRGRREVVHPVGRASWSVSVRRQVGNHDDALMRRRYGAGWRRAVDAYPTRIVAHALTTACAAGAIMSLLARRPALAAACASAWAVSTARFTAARARPGPRLPAELATLVVTSAAIPTAAVWHRLRGELRVFLDARAGLPPTARIGPSSSRRAVLFDRDGTLVHDVPYNGDPDAVRVIDGAVGALADLRAAGVRVAVVTNQSGVARQLLTLAAVDAVNRRVEDELGPVECWLVCPHAPDSGCRCRKPAPGLVFAAATRLGLRPEQCVVIGDTEADVAAARAAGARGILVANAATRPAEVARAPESAPTLRAAVDRVMEVV
ncbi:MAG TPA: HAD-IIIA family hydrolase [Acidimicrobiia bacterium]|nr:HAD-IIIA family hydrolase [Acidimicrobiia bacterium]